MGFDYFEEAFAKFDVISLPDDGRFHFVSSSIVVQAHEGQLFEFIDGKITFWSFVLLVFFKGVAKTFFFILNFQREKLFEFEIWHISVHGFLFGDNNDIFESEFIMNFLAIDERGIIDDEVILVNGCFEVEEGGIGLHTFEGGEGEHGSSVLVGGKHVKILFNFMNWLVVSRYICDIFISRVINSKKIKIIFVFFLVNFEGRQSTICNADF